MRYSIVKHRLTARLAKRLALSALMVIAALTLTSVDAKATDSTPASSEQSVLTMEDGSNIVTMVSHGSEAKSTFVILNDLLTELKASDTLATALANEGHTVVRYAYSGQAENLRLLKDGEEPKMFEKGMDLSDLSKELDTTLLKLGISQKVHLVGMSFGAAVAVDYATRHPEKVEDLILLAPLVSPIDHYDPNGRSLRLWLSTIRFWENAPCAMYGFFNPMLCRATNFWYDSFFKAMHENSPSAFVKAVPAGVNDANYKKGVFHLLRAVRDFDLRSQAMELKNVHMIMAGEDEALLRNNQELSWDLIGSKEKRSIAVIKGASHDLEVNSPMATAKWLSKIAEKQESMQSGKHFEIDADPKP